MDEKERENEEKTAEEVTGEAAEEKKTDAPESADGDKGGKKGKDGKAPEKINPVSVAALIVILLVIVAGGVFLIIEFLVPALKYSHAQSLMEKGEYVKAVSVFESLGEYKESRTLINTCYLKNQGEDFYKTVTKAKFGDTVKFGSFEQDNNYDNGKEPIEWRVLTTDGKDVLLLSKYVLIPMPFNNDLADTSWEFSHARRYLNTKFFDRAFGDAEKPLIPTVECERGITPYNSAVSSNPTEDKVFLINVTDAESYFPDNADRMAFPTDWARVNGLRTEENSGCRWWTRTSGSKASLACMVYGSGALSMKGINVNKDGCGLRPAIWIHVE